MLQQFFAWIKSLFSKSSPIHHEDNGLWWQQTGTIVKVGLSTEIIKELATITFLDTSYYLILISNRVGFAFPVRLAGSL